MALSISQLKKYMACPMAWWWQYSIKRKATQPYNENFALGTLVHKRIENGLNTFLSLRGQGVPFDSAITRSRDAMGAAHARIGADGLYNQVVIDKAAALMEIYAPRIFGVPELYEPLAGYIEKQFICDLFGVSFIGYIDAIMRDEEGRLFIVDWKTQGTPMGKDDRAILLDIQLPLYMYVAQKFFNLNISGGKIVALGTNPKRPHFEIINIPLSSLDWALPIIERQIEDLQEDIKTGLFTPTANQYTCDSCQYLENCYNLAFDIRHEIE